MEIKLKTKLTADIDGRECGYYTATLSYKKGKALVSIHPTPDTAGQWDYKLETLLGLDLYYNPPSDFIWLDHGQQWGVSNMLALLREIVNLEKPYKQSKTTMTMSSGQVNDFTLEFDGARNAVIVVTKYNNIIGITPKGVFQRYPNIDSTLGFKLTSDQKLLEKSK